MYILEDKLSDILEEVYVILDNRASHEAGNCEDLIRGMALVEAIKTMLKSNK